MQKLFFVTLAASLLSLCLIATPGRALTLAKNGKSPYVIALANDAIPAETTAAQQFQKYFSEVTGANLTIKNETAVDKNAPQILIGMGSRAKVLLSQKEKENLGSDGIIIKTVGKDLILTGDRPRGSLYAVFQFLEDQVGCRWWTPTESTIPHKSTFTIPALDVNYTPPFAYREHFTTAVQAAPIFAAIMRENGDHQKQDAAWGGHYTILGFVHTFSQLLPPQKYFKEHPEWYSDPDNGNKPCTAASKMPAPQQTQLNLSDPAVLDELTKQALAWIAKNPDAGYISIAQNDNRNYCTDPASMALAEKEGSQSAPVLDFVNKVAARIHQKYPDFKVVTLAYQYTIKPPETIRPAKNVIIELAPIQSDYGHPLDSDWNQETRANIEAWSRISPELFVWNYVTNFRNTVLPHPDWKGLGPDLRFFAANHATGVFEQGDNYTNGVGDFVQLRAWLIAHLMWNPNLDQEKLTGEFLRGYYGAAAPYLKQYLDLIEQSFLALNIKLATSGSDYSFLNLETANKAITLFKEAQNAVAGQKVLLDRVTRENLSLKFAVLRQYNFFRQTAANEHKPFLGPADPVAAMTEDLSLAQKFGIKKWNEGNSFISQIPKLQSMFAPPAPLPDFAKTYPKSDVIDIQENNFHLYKEGKVSNIVKDAAASNGVAVSVAGTTKAWAIQANLGWYLGLPSKWHVYAMVRVDTNNEVPQTGSGLSAGVYDVSNRKFISNSVFPLKSVAGKDYQRVDLGSHTLSSSMYIWFAPMQNPAVSTVYVDRIILIREQ